MVDRLVHIGDGGKERNSEGRCEERDGWDEMKEKEGKSKGKKIIKIIRVM